MLPDTAQTMLKAVARPLGDPRIGDNHPELNRVIEKIQQLYPERYHTETSLHHRVFVDEPRYNIPGTWLRDCPRQIKGGR